MMAAIGNAASAAAVAPSAPPTLDALLAARTVWRAGRMDTADAEAESTGYAELDSLLPHSGWPPHALTELLLPADGIGELSLLLPTLARMTQAGETVVLVAPPYIPYAPAWQAAGVDLAQLQIVQATPRDAPWAFEQCLRSGACAAVLGWPATVDAQALRRLQVAADSGQCLAFALRDRRHAANPSPAALRIEALGSEGGVEWAVRKCRGGNAPARTFLPRSVSIDEPQSHVAGLCESAERSAGAADIGAALRLAQVRTITLSDASGATGEESNASGRNRSDEETGAKSIRAQARSHAAPTPHPQAIPVGATMAALAKANGAGGNAFEPQVLDEQAQAESRSIGAQARSHKPLPPQAQAASVEAALAATAKANGAAGNAFSRHVSADALKEKRMRSRARPQVRPCVSDQAGLFAGFHPAGSNVADEHRTLPRAWPQRTHPHDPRTLFD